MSPLEGKVETGFYAANQNTQSGGSEQDLWQWLARAVIETLLPGDKTEEDEDVRLDAEGDVEVRLGEVVHAEGDAGEGPEEVHCVVQTGGAVAAIIFDDLGDELCGLLAKYCDMLKEVYGVTYLDGPAYGTGRSEDVCSDGIVHGLFQ